MSFDESAFINHMFAPPLVADEAALSYLARSGHGGRRFEHDLMAPSSMQVGGAQPMGVPLDVTSLAARTGIAPIGFETPEEDIMAASYNVLDGVSTGDAAAPQPQTGSNGDAMPFKGSWMEEEDSILKDMVMQLGERKWSVIAQFLPGRIGKQCRERWINHLRPDIKQNDIWTEEDDKILIGAHRHFGNRWASIARFLPGRTENAVKNHWNATKRSLKAKRRLKKKKSEQVPPGQLSLLEEYIRSGYPAEFATSPPPASPPPQPQSLAYDGLVNSGDVHMVAPETEMSFINTANPVGPNMPKLPDLNISCDPQEAAYMGYPMCASAPVPQLPLVTQDPQQACFDWFPFPEYFTAPTAEYPAGPYYYAGASSSNAVANSYYSEASAGYYSEAGPSGVGGSGGEPAAGTDNIVELASRDDFLGPSNDEVTLDFSRFE